MPWGKPSKIFSSCLQCVFSLCLALAPEKRNTFARSSPGACVWLSTPQLAAYHLSYGQP